MPMVTALRSAPMLASIHADPLLALREMDPITATKYGRNHVIVVGLDFERRCFGTDEEFIVDANPPELPA